jgi:3-dehydroquinate synthetase
VIELHHPPNWLDDKIVNSTRYFADLAALIPRAVQVKVNVVKLDPYEQNIRAHLNLGHTFAHAIEQVSGYSWLHGEAVGVGLIAAVQLSHRLGLCSAGLVGRVSEATRAVALPQRMNGLDVEEVYGAMFTDKKWRGGRSRFVLLEGMGKPTIVENVAESEVMAVLESLR